jgi:hypothetical protein
MVAKLTDDFMILGPSMGSGGKVLTAVHALYFLPDNFKMVLTGSEKADQSFLDEISLLVHRDEIGHRIQFDNNVNATNAVVLPNIGMSRTRNSVAGDSPEALASAILHLARSRA